MSEIVLRPMREAEWERVGRLVHASTNAWYRAHRGHEIFSDPPEECAIFPRVYEALDPGCCLLAWDGDDLLGSCFWHPRETHVSVGIVNVAPDAFGRGVASALLRAVLAEADARNLPTRLVSSALNLDSYSLYTKLGFVPRQLFQDMQLPAGASLPALPESAHVRPGRPSDAPKMAALERERAGLSREKDFAYFLKNTENIWGVSVLESLTGELEGFLASVNHPASRMLGPGFSLTESGMAALIRAESARFGESPPVMVVPAESAELVRILYGWGARNLELHVAQVRGEWRAPDGVWLPTFLPETG